MMKMKQVHQLGIDIGSTTVKCVLLDGRQQTVFGAYRRHQTEVFPVTMSLLEEIRDQFGDIDLQVLFTGTAGMGVAERSGLSFVQEVQASAEVVRKWMPEVRTFIDLGGEDTKIIFFDDHLRPDIRMNGNCAGGTGALLIRWPPCWISPWISSADWPSSIPVSTRLRHAAASSPRPTCRT